MKYCFDIDGTICCNTFGKYEEARPIHSMIEQINALYRNGHTILLFTARGSTTGIDWRELTEKQMHDWGVLYHELILGKPEADLYIDDKGMSIEEWSRSLKTKEYDSMKRERERESNKCARVAEGKSGFDIWDCYNGLLISSDVERIRKLLVRSDLFRQALGVPGDVIECGVFKGAGVFFWLKLLAIYAPVAQKKVIGFDTFGAFADSLLDYERKSAGAFVAEADFKGASPSELMGIAEKAGLGHRLELVAGDIIETAPKYVADNPGFRISLLHLDFDTYHGTKAALEAFYKVISPGGLIVLDEYGKRGWGESDAVDEFLTGKGVKLEAVNEVFQPTAFFRKPL